MTAGTGRMVMKSSAATLAQPGDGRVSSLKVIAGGASKEVIRLANVRKTFRGGGRDVAALGQIDLSVRNGEFITVIGPSGCGKSTLFNILVGLMQPDPGGEMYLHGEKLGPNSLLGKIAFMPQRDMLLPWRTVLDNAILGVEVAGQGRREARRRAMDVIGEFGLAGFDSHYPHQLSGGMRQRVALMRTFLFERDLMLLDEPFGALDALTRSMMQQWLLKVWEHFRRTILFITHDIDEAIFLADRVLVISARPGTIKLDIPVHLERPRPSSIVTSSDFIALKRQLLEAVEEESMKTFASQGEGAPQGGGK